MVNFNNSRWSDSSFSKEYRDRAEDYVPARSTLIAITLSLYKRWFGSGQSCRVLDLGCGDGRMVQQLFHVDPTIDATLVDGSQDMLAAAANRLARFRKVRYVHASFQELMTQELPCSYSFVLSSLAIHHLGMAEKEALFDYVYRHLDPGGFFLNIDLVLSPTNALEDWYLALWKEWIDAHVPSSQKPSLLTVPRKYKENADNVPDPLLPQLRAMERIGFKNVDCVFKYGLFAMFGGSKS